MCNTTGPGGSSGATPSRRATLHENDIIGLAAIFFLGIASQWLAEKMRWPGIVVLIAVGLTAGPVTGFLDPDHLLGAALQPLVALSVAVILFEGGLSLHRSDFGDLETLSSVKRLVVIGSLVTWASVTLLAMAVLGFRFELAFLLGAILVVTGPTVIVPLLRQVGLVNRVGTILKWEGMINDPIGAVLAVVVFEAIRGGEFRDFSSIALTSALKTVGVAFVGGLLFASVFAFCLRRFWVPDHLQSPLALTTALLLYAASDLFQPESGLAAVILYGLFLSHSGGISLIRIRGFKENLSVLLISSLFIVLSARLDWETLRSLEPSWIAFLVLVVLVVRPVAVFVSAWGSGLTWREKLYLSAIGPRGIVAASIASVFSLNLDSANYPAAGDLVGITFLVITGSVVFSGTVASPLARSLGFARQGKGKLLLLGAQPRARRFALELMRCGIPVLVVDRKEANIRAATEEGLEAVRADILSSELKDRIEFNEIGALLAALPNDEVNSLAVLKYRHELGQANVFRIVAEKGEHPELGRTFGGLTREDLARAWDEGHVPRAVEITEDVRPERPLVILHDGGDWEVVDEVKNLKPGQKVIALG